MGNSKSKKAKEPENFFIHEKLKEKKRDEKIRKKLKHKRNAVKMPAIKPGSVPPTPPVQSTPPPTPAHIRSYDTEAIDRMRRQLHNDSNAFLLNNILLSVQFFENYEREVHQIKNNPISDREQMINEDMVRHHKHVFFADQLQECVQEHVRFQRPEGQLEPLSAPRLFVIYDNVEASEPGDTSDYSAVLDAPFYKLCSEDSKDPGYIRLKKLEVLESTQTKEKDLVKPRRSLSDSLYTDSDKESIDSDDFVYPGKGKELLQNIQTKLIKSSNMHGNLHNKNVKVNSNVAVTSGRRRSGPTRQLSALAEKSNISNMNSLKKTSLTPFEEAEIKDNIKNASENKPRKSCLKTTSGTITEMKGKQYDIVRAISENTITEDAETSGYTSRSTSGSRQTEFSENDSDYGYSTITESTTPKKLELREPSNYSVTSGVLPEECWSQVQFRAINNWSDDDEDLDDTARKVSLSRNLYETYYYLSSMNFMKNFGDNFIINLGSSLGLNQEAINNALTQGASVYCDTTKNGTKISYEVFPALLADWPNAANEWILRERKIIQNPRTNFSYQWPTKYMVNKAIGFGCMLVPIGFRPKRGLNPEQLLQWRIVFPAAERYLESCLAHSHMRCYLFALVLHKTFMENNNSKVGIDASHIKNHLFRHCEDNFAKWPEDRLGETLRLFLDTFYIYFGQNRLPNYFIDNCNDFKSIPKPLLRHSQRSLGYILESPVMHLLSALDKLKYTKNDFYPPLDCYRLFEILTCSNPLRIINPNIVVGPTNNNNDSSDESEDDNQTNIWEKAKKYDKNYQWNKERQRREERRKAQLNTKKHKAANKNKEINANIIFPPRMPAERRYPVLDFFISHFIAMARSSERFEAIRQAIIYLEQAQRFCVLLKEEPGGSDTANEYLVVIREKLADCQRKLVNQAGFKLPKRESQMDRTAQRPIRDLRPRFKPIVNQDSPTDTQGISAFTFVDVHVGNSSKDNIRFNNDSDEQSQL